MAQLPKREGEIKGSAQESAMVIIILRVSFVLAHIIMGVIWASFLIPDEYPHAYVWIAIGGFIGSVISMGVIYLVAFVSQEMFERILPAVAAIVLAFAVGWGIAQCILIMLPSLATNPYFRTFLVTSFLLIFAFIGSTLGLTRVINRDARTKDVRRRPLESAGIKLLDTSVIIDGRLAEVCKTGFLEGTFVVPRFILRELQSIADSDDMPHRACGRRGLDTLHRLREPDSGVEVQVIEDDPLDVCDVDGKLVRLARQFAAKIVTNDLNLNKVAQIEKVQVLDLNELADALKPGVLHEEQMYVKVVKEGKEAYQGVGYLDDGTMVVVDGGKEHVGRDVAVVVTSVLQTTVGRMVFTKLHQVLS